ncbi:uncharacterized protein PITG_02097 [Phytophthora infestans T30-4]|uniref:Uncharacterized protein n=1 Tax=Phytophthora infestans (strain T30-4) TaxID=403677 RepID=D0MVG8_PHYIT|nr:uncharacterized protein PITG_02097 [Phytophthora infestans T30-4]EEY63631.1 hypothetical protein PITG_02097 [Phytophthora infestans T30-4]|eukprot:XP_002907067.1 hypothetical protein PITG_02097 [Phytophthora infestans T30-4]
MSLGYRVACRGKCTFGSSDLSGCRQSIGRTSLFCASNVPGGIWTILEQDLRVPTGSLLDQFDPVITAFAEGCWSAGVALNFHGAWRWWVAHFTHLNNITEHCSPRHGSQGAAESTEPEVGSPSTPPHAIGLAKNDVGHWLRQHMNKDLLEQNRLNYPLPARWHVGTWLPRQLCVPHPLNKVVYEVIDPPFGEYSFYLEELSIVSSTSSALVCKKTSSSTDNVTQSCQKEPSKRRWIVRA